MHIHPINDFSLGSLIMEVIFDSIGHVVGHQAMFKHNMASGGVDIDSITSVVGYVGITDCNHTIRLSYVDTCNETYKEI